MPQIKLFVYRRLDNRFKGEPDTSDFALELHNRRKAALHAVFDDDPQITVEDWGSTDDVRSHEFVELSLVLAAKALHYAIVPGLLWLGTKLAEKGFDALWSEGAKAIVSKLRGEQKERRINDFDIKFPDGTTVTVHPPDGEATIRIHLKDGSMEVTKYQEEPG